MFKSLATLVMALALVLCMGINGGAMQSPLVDPPQIKASTSLELTTPEKEFLKQLSQKITPIQEGLEKTWKLLLVTEDEKEAVNLWLKAKLLNLKAADVQKEFQVWFDTVKANHKCPDCNLQGDRLVPAKPSTPVADTPKP